MWDVATGKVLGSPVLLDGVKPVSFSANGRTLAVAGSGGQIVVWQAAPPPLVGAVERIRLWVEVLTGLELDNRGVVNVLSPDAVQRYQRLPRRTRRSSADPRCREGNRMSVLEGV